MFDNSALLCVNSQNNTIISFVNLWAKNYFLFCVLPLKTWQPIWSYLAICKINECFCEYLALQLAQTNGFFPSWTASMWFNKLRLDEKQLTHWSHLKGVSCTYHNRFMVSWNSISKSLIIIENRNQVPISVLVLEPIFLQNFFSLKSFQSFSCFPTSFENFVVEQRSTKLIKIYLVFGSKFGFRGPSMIKKNTPHYW